MDTHFDERKQYPKSPYVKNKCTQLIIHNNNNIQLDDGLHPNPVLKKPIKNESTNIHRYNKRKYQKKLEKCDMSDL